MGVWDSFSDTCETSSGSRRSRHAASIELRARQGWLAAAVDFLALAAVTAAAFAVAAWLSPVVFNRPYELEIVEAVQKRALEFALLSALALFIFAGHGHYQARLPLWVQAKHVILACGLLLLTDGFVQYVTQDEFSRSWVLLGWGFAPLAILTARMLSRRVMTKMGLWLLPTIIVGGGRRAREARAAIASAPELGFDVREAVPLATLGREARCATETKAEALGPAFDVNLLARYRDGLIVIAPDAEEMPHAERLARLLTRLKVAYALVPPLREVPLQGLQVQHFFSHDVSMLTPRQNLDYPLPQLVKRSFDLVISIAALLFLSPVFAVFALLVARDGGPMFFAHERIGRHGLPFRCLKFRTMAADAEATLEAHLADNPEAAAEWEASRKLTDDVRVTPLGRFLRATSLDELPQLVNVVRGDMSLVGPRPIVQAELEQYYGDDAHFYLQARPGVTGLWQISGRSDTSYRRRVHLDAWYVRNWSVWYDVAILIRTVPAVLSQRGAR